MLFQLAAIAKTNGYPDLKIEILEGLAKINFVQIESKCLYIGGGKS